MKKALPFIIGLLAFTGYAQVPANDNCSNAQVITVNSGNVSGTMVQATNSSVPNCPSTASYSDVWYKFTATTNEVNLILQNITPSAILRTSFFNNNCSDTTPIKCGSYVNNLVIGQDYKIRVYTGENTPVTLNCTFNISILAPTEPNIPITVSTSQYTTEQLITDVFFNSGCVQVSNITSSTGTNFGSVNGIGYFESNGADFDLAEGIVLSTGNVENLPGYNTSSLADGDIEWVGDNDLFNLIGENMVNASKLEFDFTSTANHFSFNYIYASDEYPVFACSQSDPCAFLLTDLVTGISTNLAVIPNTLTPVAATTIHPQEGLCQAANADFFDQLYTGVNIFNAPFNFNGLTVTMEAYADIIPNHPYHLKMVIADEIDLIMDSAVFLAPANFDLPELDTAITSNTGNFIFTGQPTTLNLDTNEELSFQWYLNGEAIPQANDPALTVNEAGHYEVFAAVAAGSSCGYHFEYTLIPLNYPEDLTMCDPDGDSYAQFDLTSNDAVILNGLNAADYTITYHENDSDAYAGIAPIPNPTTHTNLTSLAEPIYVHVVHNSTGAETVLIFNIIVNAAPQFELPFGSFCQDYITGEITPYILNSGFTANEYSFQWYLNGVIIDSANQPVFPATMEGSYTVEVTNIVTGCTGSNSAVVMQSGPASPIGEGYTITDQQVTVNVEGYGNYVFSLDNADAQESNIFDNVAPGVHTINVTDETGCGTLSLTFNITPDAPEGASSQTFIEGETLANLEVTGENIQWYDGIGPDSTNNTMEAPLPIDTALTDGTTYFASQTINGIESTDRLAVTVHATMGTQEQTFTGLQYYPNPVTNTLTISNTNVLDNITVYNFLGQLVLSKNVSAQATVIDFSSLTTGIYTVKVNSAGQSKTIKIQKN